MHVRCPHCRNPIEIVEESSLSEVACPSCGSTFSLLGDDATVTYRGDGARTLGHFQLLERIGLGAFGAVWKARDGELDRTVAIKIPRKDTLDREEADQFLREARAAAQLRHPGIVSVHEVGRQDDTIYIVSDYVQGVTLADWLTSQRPAARESAELCVKIAEALDHAHSAGVIHRDLKPSNIMLQFERQDLRPVAGEMELQPRAAFRSQAAPVKPVLMDFGLARREAGEITVTLEGNVLGTPAYMSPEQARGEAHQADRRTDIYSLGVILFELLTGEQPFRGNARMLLHHVIHDDPPTPRRLNASLPRDLETICLKCLEKEPARRYATAQALSEDLRRFLNGQPIAARPLGRPARIWRWARRNRAAAALICFLTFALIIGSWNLWAMIERQRVAAVASRVERLIREAQRAALAGELDRADSLVQSAAARARFEPQLSAVAAGVEAQLAHIRLTRQTQVRSSIDKLIADAESELYGQDFAAARALLAEARFVAEREPDLTDVRNGIDQHLRAVEARLTTARAREAAQQQFSQFLGAADRVRFLTSQFLDDDVEAHRVEAQRLALGALVVYGLAQEQATPREDRLTHLSEPQIAAVRSTAYELMLSLAKTEMTLAPGAQGRPAESAERALIWIRQAKALGLSTRSLLLREAAVLKTLGRGRESALATESASQMQPSSELDFFLLAEETRTAGDYDEALGLYRLALQTQPIHFWSWYGSGLCHLARARDKTRLQAPERQRDLEAAAANFTHCISQRPDLTWSYLARGAVYGELNRYVEALADLARVQELDPAFAGVYLSRGSVFLAQAQAEDRAELYERAAADFRRAAQLRPDSAAAYASLGELARARALRLERGAESAQARTFNQQAFEELTRAIELAPHGARAYRLRGDVNMRLQRAVDAVSDLRRAAELATSLSEQSEIFIELGRVYHSQRDYEQALKACDDALAASRQSASAHFLRAETLQRLGRHVDAADAFNAFLERQAVVRNAPDGQVPFMLAKAYRFRGERSASQRAYRGAMEDYIRALEHNPRSFEALARRGWAYLLEATRLAEADFEDAIRLNPSDPDHWAGRGYARVLSGRYEDAISDAEQAAKLARSQAAQSESRIWIDLFNAATIYAQAADRAEHDRSLDSGERMRRTERYRSRAIELLQDAEAVAGPAAQAQFRAALQQDPALDPLREQRDFLKAWPPPGGKE